MQVAAGAALTKNQKKKLKRKKKRASGWDVAPDSPEVEILTLASLPCVSAAEGPPDVGLPVWLRMRFCKEQQLLDWFCILLIMS